MLVFLKKSKESFDIILCLEVLEHLASPVKTLSLIRRVCHPRSLLLVSIPNGYGPYQLLFDLPGKIIHRILEPLGLIRPYRDGSRHLTWFSRELMRKICELSGFEILWKGNAYILGFLSVFFGEVFSVFDSLFTERIHPRIASGWYYILRPLHRDKNT